MRVYFTSAIFRQTISPPYCTHTSGLFTIETKRYFDVRFCPATRQHASQLYRPLYRRSIVTFGFCIIINLSAQYLCEFSVQTSRYTVCHYRNENFTSCVKDVQLLVYFCLRNGTFDVRTKWAEPVGGSPNRPTASEETAQQCGVSRERADLAESRGRLH